MDLFATISSAVNAISGGGGSNQPQPGTSNGTKATASIFDNALVVSQQSAQQAEALLALQNSAAASNAPLYTVGALGLLAVIVFAIVSR